MSLLRNVLCAVIISVGVDGLLSTAARAESAETYYRGKTVSILIGHEAGGGYDLFGRLVAKYLSDHIPGRPTVIVINKVGAAGLAADNSLYNVEKRDGTVLGMPNQTIAIAQKLGYSGVAYDAERLNWIGRITPGIEVVGVSKASGVKAIDDVKKTQVVMGANSSAGTSSIYPQLLNNLTGTKFKVVYGYPGMNSIWLAMEKGEVFGGAFSYAELKSAKADWLRDGRLIILAQVAFERQETLPNAPLLLELGKTELDRQVLRLYSSGAEIGRSLTAPPDVPTERMAALRAAFDETMKDPIFIAQAKKINADIGPLSGEQLQKIVSSSVEVPDEVAKAAKAAVRPR
jgi:tripartite-type tricarboxylate transporter receptor subunit TctC